MIHIPKGTKDILPSESHKWQKVRDIITTLAKRYNLKQIDTPAFEHTELFTRGVGNSSDIVNKEMYTFLDKGGRSITLRAEGTAPVVRSFVENAMWNQPLPLKLFYLNANFRYERPQAGRLRQHHQFGLELFGSSSYTADAEVIFIMNDFYKALDISPTFSLNTIGCTSDRANFITALKQNIQPNLEDYCADCKRRFEQNPLRILDCKNQKCNKMTATAPKLSEFLCEECTSSFKGLLDLLQAQNINYKVSDNLVRGFDYYTGLVLEVEVEGVDYAMGGGGRFDNLVEELDGKPTPVVGFGIGIERLLLYLEQAQKNVFNTNDPTIYVANATKDTTYITNLIQELRQNNISAETDLMTRSLRAQFRYADKLQFKYVVVVGDDEISSGKFTLKNMQTGKELSVNKEQLIQQLIK